MLQHQAQNIDFNAETSCLKYRLLKVEVIFVVEEEGVPIFLQGSEEATPGMATGIHATSCQ